MISSKIPVISEHDTWISIDPIVGCPANCQYCFIQKYNLTQSKPEIRSSPEDTLKALIAYLNNDPNFKGFIRKEYHRILCMGNYTDMFLAKSNISFLVEFIRLLHEQLPNFPLVLISKAKIQESTAQTLDEIGHPIIFFISQSFFNINSNIERGVASPEDSIRTIKLLSGCNNIHPLHFWRPITRLNVPTKNDAIEQINMVKAAGSVASVAVGLKFGEALFEIISQKKHPLIDTLNEKSSVNTPNGEIFPPDLLENILAASKELEYSVYLNTSCAVSKLLKVKELLGTWKPDSKEQRCLPVFCAVDQRQRCSENDKTNSPDKEALEEITKYLQLPQNSVTWDSRSHSIKIMAVVDQNLLCRLGHLTGHKIHCLSVDKTREWTGAHFAGLLQVDDLSTIAVSKNSQLLIDLKKKAKRLKGVTGLISPAYDKLDPRRSLFNRYDHVQRELAVALSVCQEIIDAGGDINIEKVTLLTWANDLNRWPFAHNGEFNSSKNAANLNTYFKKSNLNIETQVLLDLIAIKEKKINQLSQEAQIVLTATRVTGAIEDILLSITALGLTPKKIPKFVTDHLSLPISDNDFLNHLHDLRRQTIDQSTLLQFKNSIDLIVTSYSHSCLLKEIESFVPFQISEHFNSTSLKIRKKFLEPILFPIVNNEIGKGRNQKSKIILSLFNHLSSYDLESLTDEQAIELAIQKNLFDKNKLYDILPDLDYIPNNRPELEF